MNTAQNDEQAPRKPLRLWPGVAAAVLLCVVKFGLPIAAPDATVFAMLGGVVCGVIVLGWWAFFSRAPRPERWGALLLMLAGSGATWFFIDKSIRTGMMGFMFPFYSIPVLGLAIVGWAVLSQRLPDGLRRASMVAAILLACGGWTLLRTEGIRGGGADLAWRWAKTSEEKLVASPLPAALPAAAPEPVKTQDEPATAVKTEEQPIAELRAPVAVKTEFNWPGFRGPGRDSVIPGLQIKTDWSATPPVELWRRQIGPGWSSFAVRGDLIYTQEQRGGDEVVSCYNATSGVPVWAHRDAARFWESNAGAGPRATPTLHGGRVYSFGATGILNALDARTGAVLWSRNAAADTGRKIPAWGFSSSPLLVGDMVVVATAGQLAAYEAATGAPRWYGPAGGGGYSSPQLLNIDGVEQILLISGVGATSVAPADGAVLWKYAWPDAGGILQTGVTADGNLLIGGGGGMGGTGIRRIAVTHGAAGWAAEERWTSSGLKPYFSDFVVHEGHAFGFDGSILACIDLKDGKRKWKGGRYGQGQLVLLRDQGLLLVLSEEGEVALVSAGTDQFKELARFPAMEGKTWNHPVVVGERLLVRNGSEMVALRLPVARP